MKYNSRINAKSVKSFNPCKSVILTFYDIVKSHGGELIAQTKEGEFTEFLIKLPYTQLEPKN